MPSSLSDSSRPSVASATGPGVSVAAALSDPELLKMLAGIIRRKIPAPDADDVLQATLADALSASHVPEDAGELRRWVCGIVRNKIADYYRMGRREIPHEDADLDATADGIPQTPEPHSARDLLRWAEGSLPETDAAQQTFDWMLREGQGEKLEAIAAEAKLPAPQVRKRVSRLRQHLKQKWVLELAAVAALGIAALLARQLLRGNTATIDVGPDRSARTPEPEHANQLRQAAELRRTGLEACAARDFRLCLERLDEAAALDVLGDASEEVRRARDAARTGAALPQSLPAGPARAPDTKLEQFAPVNANPPIDLETAVGSTQTDKRKALPPQTFKPEPKGGKAPPKGNTAPKKAGLKGGESSLLAPSAPPPDPTQAHKATETTPSWANHRTQQNATPLTGPSQVMPAGPKALGSSSLSSESPPQKPSLPRKQ